MRRVIAAFVLGLALAFTLPVASQVSYPVALWPVADVSNANRLVREALTAARTYYVRTDGHDTNCDGKTNASDASTSTTACGFLTIQRAVDIAYGTIDLKSYDVTIQIADGTYTGQVSIGAKHLGAGNVIIQGNNATPANVVVSTTGFAITATNGVRADIRDLKITTATSGSCLYAERGAVLYFRNIDFGASANAHIHSTDVAIIQADGNYAVTGGAARHWYVGGPSIIRVGNKTITISASLTFTYWVEALLGGVAVVNGNTYAGSAITGTRYYAYLNGVVYTNGAPTGLPGTGGSTATGGQVN